MGRCVDCRELYVRWEPADKGFVRRHIASALLSCAAFAVVVSVPKAASISDSVVFAVTAPTTSSQGLDPRDILLADAEGRVVLDLTVATGGVTGTTNDREPAWSPDGNRLAFVRRDRLPVIYVADIDGGNLRRLANGSEPTWSPDGRRIAFRAGAGTIPAILVIDGDGSGLRIVGTRSFGPAGPAWSPDGQVILYGCGGPEPPATTSPADLCLADPDAATATRTIWDSDNGRRGRALGASFSPDGRSIAVMTNRALHVIDRGTGVIRWRSTLSSQVFYTTPLWSPDGRHIAFVGYILGHCCVGRGRATWVDIYAVDADGTGLRRLTGVRDRPLESNSLPDSIGGGLEPDNEAPVWWPNGSRLFFERPRLWPPSVPRIYMMNADGTCETRFVLHDVPVRTEAAAPYGPAWRPGAHSSSRPLNCVDVALAPKLGQDTQSTLQFPHVVVHDFVSYTITVKNDGTLPATGLVLSISSRGSARIVRAPHVCTRRRATIACRLPNDLPAGGEATIGLSVEATHPSGEHGGVAARVTSRETAAEADSANNRVGFTFWVRPTSVAGELPLAPILGTDGSETLFGRRGGDVIRARAGDDQLYAGDGNDRIYGGDGRDLIHCGRGTDIVFADREDVIARDCERVRRAR